MADKWRRELYYGDNLDVMKKMKSEQVDLCYIDPPFNSNRNYNQIYMGINEEEDAAQAEAFVDTWTWNEFAQKEYEKIKANEKNEFTNETISLIEGLERVLDRKSMLAYLVSMTSRINEIHRLLKPTGSFYLHCDPTASHYIKLVLDAIFMPNNGQFQNELIWHYQTGGASKKRFSRKHDVIFWYTKSLNWKYYGDRIAIPRTEKSLERAQNPNGARISVDDTTKNPNDVLIIQQMNPMARERLGYPTQKPEALLDCIIKASSDEGDIILDAFCGCGTSVAVAERLKRQWIGIDITYHSIDLIIRRLLDQADPSNRDSLEASIILDGVPRDMQSAIYLANKKDDRVRKEFEKWAILTYTEGKARINTTKGADKGIDGIANFLKGKTEKGEFTFGRVVFQVKSGNVNRGDIAQFNEDRAQHKEKPEMGIFITLQEPTKPMFEQANMAGKYHSELMDRDYPVIRIVTIKDLIENKEHLELPTGGVLAVKQAPSSDSENQTLGL